ncbi:aspartate kinase [Pontibacter sp. 172403-2]|uniref:aspartate kinase n=1 Tax=Pontibacter rufus TaxID=2791028 RepID=UPI0018AFB1FB|nr:aspartate kinase [Pontibacter sp. 172403-2]MBF9252355.1 aspartate kinase [Pontibacter sp. 172403-2]
MKVFKFGGASIKNPEAFQNLAAIVQEHGGTSRLLIVVSAMGKTTDALEQVYKQAFQGEDYQQALQQIWLHHQQVLAALFPDAASPAHERLEQLYTSLQQALQAVSPSVSYDQQYDQVVSYGELFASVLLHCYLQQQSLQNTWIDSRRYIMTDNSWREAKVDWARTERLIKRNLPPILAQQLVVAPGFLGGTGKGLTTTLGRDGSDFSAAIFAYGLEAAGVWIWKDVEGLLNADPKYFPDTVCYPEISYQETVEMAYYGASVIHPKTIKPLANKLIPLYVKSFLNPAGKGTKIFDCRFGKIAPAYIIKENQCLVSFSVKDFTFISEKNLGTIFHALSELRMKINLMQNSAISFSICSDFHQERLHRLIEMLHDQFVIHYNTNLHLYTIKNYTPESLQLIVNDRKILMEQRTRTTLQFVCQ